MPPAPGYPTSPIFQLCIETILRMYFTIVIDILYMVKKCTYMAVHASIHIVQFLINSMQMCFLILAS